MLPNLALLEKISNKIQNLENRQGEYKRKAHYCCYLLCQKAGLRISEAISFDLNSKTRKGLYRIVKPKGKKKRYVYIPQQVINELKKHDWKPQQTNRFNFYHFLKRIKKELGIDKKIELSPHTLRRAFATYHAEAGLPLPLLSKLLGHKSVRTTALYWMNIYNNDGNDPDDILTAKIWPKKPRWKLKPESKSPVKINLDELSEPLTPNSLASELPPNYLSKISQLEKQLSQISNEKNKRITELEQQKKTLQNNLADLSERNTTLCQEKSQAIAEKEQVQQELTIAKEIINQLTQELANEREQRTTTENNLFTEKALLFTQRQVNQSLQEINANLTAKLSGYEKNHTNLLNAYQIAIKDKENTEKQLNQLIQEIKTAAQQLYQWQKLNHYQQLEKQNELKAQIVQPPPWKSPK